MKAQVLNAPAAVESEPLTLTEIPQPVPAAGSLLVEISVCGVCHTDLHVVEGELPDPTLPIIPGHQIVGTVVERGASASRFPIGTRVGIPWLHETDQVCEYCKRGQENLCERARFT